MLIQHRKIPEYVAPLSMEESLWVYTPLPQPSPFTTMMKRLVRPPPLFTHVCPVMNHCCLSALVAREIGLKTAWKMCPNKYHYKD